MTGNRSDSGKQAGRWDYHADYGTMISQNIQVSKKKLFFLRRREK